MPLSAVRSAMDVLEPVDIRLVPGPAATCLDPG